MVLLQIRHLQRKQKYKLSKQQQQHFLHLLSDMLQNGFTIYESFIFMKKSASFPVKTIQHIIDVMEKGLSFDYSLDALGFNQQVIIQIHLAQAHGNLVDTLKKLNQHLKAMTKQQKKLYKVLTYPMLLLLFLMGIVFCMRQFLLPQLLLNESIQKDNSGVRFIQQSPYYLIGFIISSSLIYILIKGVLHKKSALEKASFFAKVPILKQFYMEYVSAFFALEWGKLFFQGLEARTIIQLMSHSSYQTLMKELATETEKELIEGKALHQQVANYTFFSAELAMIIQQGETKGNLGKELIIYSELCWNRLFQRIEKAIQWIQPVIFLVVALLIVSIYAAMLLPIYGNMEEYL